MVPNHVLYQVEPLPDKLVRSEGFEPPTFWFVAKHSIQLSYERISKHALIKCQKKWWLQRESNQRHQDFQSCALPTELWSQLKWRFQRDSNPRSSAWQADVLTSCTMEPIGCGDRIWTCDLRVMSPTSYRTALLRDIKMAEEKGFEPLRRLHDLPVFKTGPFNQTLVFLR